MRKLCPNCFNFVQKGDDCPICHYNFKSKKRLKKEEAGKSEPEENKAKDGISPNLEKLYAEAQKENIQEPKQQTETEVKPEPATSEKKDIYHQKNGRIKWVSKAVRDGKVKAPRKVKNPRTSGEHIDVSRFTFLGKSYNKYNPSPDRIIIENNGKYELEKLKWWEIYKWADRQLAKSKIKKRVNKEAKKKPERVSFGVLLSLCLLSGFLGVHNFYAGNIRKGLVSAISFSVAMVFVMFLDKIPFFNAYFQGLLCAVPGLICLAIWLMDTLAILFKRFKYRSSRMDFIKSLDIETRARLGKKYIYIV